MVREIAVMHHQSLRKRIHQKKETYPSKNKMKNIFDKLVYFAAIAGPIMTFPQLYNVWILKITAGVSILSWLSYSILSFIWLIYGILHKEKPIIFSSVLWVILDFLVAIGAMIY